MNFKLDTAQVNYIDVVQRLGGTEGLVEHIENIVECELTRKVTTIMQNVIDLDLDLVTMEKVLAILSKEL